MDHEIRVSEADWKGGGGGKWREEEMNKKRIDGRGWREEDVPINRGIAGGCCY
jgi:hypothetical protein